MKKNKPLISICIPTYNRATCLEGTIQSIVSQKEFTPDLIELVISDNNSTDNTKEVVERYAKEYKNIKYFKNEENINDYNFPTVLKEGEGTFRKLLNDTFRIREGMLIDIIELVQKYSKEKPVIFFLNGNGKSSYEIKEYENADRFFSEISFFNTWIGGLGIWEEDLKRIDTTKKFCSTKLWQVEALYECAELKNKFIIENKHLFMQVELQKPATLNYNIFDIFYTNLLALMQIHKEQLQISEITMETIKDDLLNIHFYNLVMSILNKKKEGTQSHSERILYRQIRKNYKCKEYIKYILKIHYNLYKNNLKSIMK